MGSRQGIITALKSQLALITVAGGYNTDIGSNVDEWRLVPYDPADLPAIEIRDESSSVIDGKNNVQNYKALNITITVYNAPSVTAATTARLHIKDVLAAIGTDTTLGNNAVDIDIEDVSLEGSQDSDIIFSAVIKLTVGYLTEKWSD
jgi:hypothetical protein